jgi:glutamyl-tRNA reductase
MKAGLSRQAIIFISIKARMLNFSKKKAYLREKDKPRKMREKVIEEIKAFLEKEEEQSPEIQKALEKFTEKVNRTPINDLSSAKQEATNFILEKRYKRKRLYWLLPARN